MINKDFINEKLDEFNNNLSQCQIQIVDTENGNFNDAIKSFIKMNENIKIMEQLVKEMKQENHNIIQDVYNRFKEKNYTKNIKF